MIQNQLNLNSKKINSNHKTLDQKVLYNLIEQDISKKDKKIDDPYKGRKLGNEWSAWDGNIEWKVDSPKKIFLSFAFAVVSLISLLGMTLFYFIEPRLNQISSYIPTVALATLILGSGYLFFWIGILFLTSYTNIKLPYLGKGNRLLLGLLLDKVFDLGDLLKYNRDKLGNSFIKVSNSFSRATKNPLQKEKLLILLPRCLTKETYQEVRNITSEFNVEMAICTGGEIARKKVKEFRPSAVIGVACERDLVSGIKDVGRKISAIGIPNIRPLGPCKNTYINYADLRNSIRFYLSA